MDELASDRPVAIGLNHLITLYKPFDDTFFGLWNKVRAQTDPGWVSQLQDQLSEAMPSYLDCTEVQAVDLRISQQWLRTMVWQLCVSQGLVSSVSTDSAMTFKYPIEISRDLLSMTHQFPQQAMEVHGVGLVSTTPSHDFKASCLHFPILDLRINVPSRYRPSPSSQSLLHFPRFANQAPPQRLSQTSQRV